MIKDLTASILDPEFAIRNSEFGIPLPAPGREGAKILWK
jgi:hypothetical protein